MKRKVIKLGNNSLLVSLPSAWAKKHGISKGDEVTLEEKEGQLLLSTTHAQAGKNTSIDITNLGPLVKRALGALYKKGYDEFTVHFADHEELELAYDVIREEFTGFEVVQHGKNHLVAREISQPHPDQFDTVLRRQFLVINDYASETMRALANKDHNWLKRLVLRDKDVNKLADFCRRLINKQQTTQTATALYFVVEQLEKISDRYKDISNYASEKRATLSKQSLKLYEEVTKYVEQFYQCFYQFSLPGVNNLVTRRKELVKALQQSGERAQPTEQRILFYLEDVVEKTFDMNGPLMVLRL